MEYETVKERTTDTLYEKVEVCQTTGRLRETVLWHLSAWECDHDWQSTHDWNAQFPTSEWAEHNVINGQRCTKCGAGRMYTEIAKGWRNPRHERIALGGN